MDLAPGFGPRGRKRTAAAAGLPPDPLHDEAAGRRSSYYSRDNPFVTPADLEAAAAAGDPDARASNRLANYRAARYGLSPLNQRRGAAIGASRGGPGSRPDVKFVTGEQGNPYSVGFGVGVGMGLAASAPSPMDEEADAAQLEGAGPELPATHFELSGTGMAVIDRARAESLQNAVSAVLRALLSGRSSFEPSEDPMSGLRPQDRSQEAAPASQPGTSPKASAATIAASATPSETDCVILGLRCLHHVYDMDGRYFHDEYAMLA